MTIIKNTSESKGIESQIQTAEFTRVISPATEDDFSEMMNFLTLKAEDNKDLKWVMITGFVGYLYMKLKTAFQKYGKQKLPRKLKKRVFVSAKLRRIYLPEYYTK